MHIVSIGVPGRHTLPTDRTGQVAKEIGYDGIALELDNNMDLNLRDY